VYFPSTPPHFDDDVVYPELCAAHQIQPPDFQFNNKKKENWKTVHFKVTPSLGSREGCNACFVTGISSHVRRREMEGIFSSSIEKCYACLRGRFRNCVGPLQVKKDRKEFFPGNS
jgi:hypothetical protein